MLGAMTDNNLGRDSTITLDRNHRPEGHSNDRVGNPHNRRLANARELVNDILDFQRTDLLPTAFDNIILAPHEIKIAILICSKEIAGIEDLFPRIGAGP